MIYTLNIYFHVVDVSDFSLCLNQSLAKKVLKYCVVKTQNIYMYYCLFVIVFGTVYKIPLDTRQVRSIRFVSFKEICVYDSKLQMFI